MRTKVRVLANIFVKDRLDESLFQFNRAIPVYRYNVIRAFIKNCPLIKNATEEDFQTVKIITIVCSNDENAIAILLQIEDLCEKPDEEIDSIESDINYIVDHLDSYDLFLQMAEEAAELSQACLKYVRAHKGNNPTKDSEDVYLKGIIEEFTDVQVCADAIDITDDSDIHDSKIHRWADRIRKKNGGNAK